MEEKNIRNNFNSYVKKVFDALSLILLGIVFLLNTTNTLPWSIWLTVFLVLASIWPLFLIVWGIQLIFSKYTVLNVVSKILSFLIFVSVLSLAIGAYYNQGLSNFLNERSWFGFITNTKIEESTFTVSKDKYKDVSRINYDIDIVGGEFYITEAKSDDLLKLNSKFTQNFGKPLLMEDSKDNVLSIGFKQESSRVFGLNLQPTEYMFALNKDSTEKNLNIKMTAGDGNVDLEETKLRDLSIDMTAGRLDVSVLDTSMPETIDIELTAGDLRLEMNEETDLKIIYKKTAGSLQIDSKDIQNREGQMDIDASGNTKTKINIKITAGSIEIIRK